ncbi:hypothetical protein CANARDRAFT_193453 [[Candida] arabinofermentans NRRL YB-2248]|uniref:Formate/nitrite transporter n=1 Tax=[Candida] arabinofermentans NRRL YB-2248 TaxID=983967 RepID=A0A1E4T7N9_9ASCO|nr:hypothetical protein CANARDRAFT_193453 [[Candida] arabinofermentans NRRL YB-2248]
MVDDTYYITPHEAALAVVATSMKKSRLKLHLLIINSIMGAFLFSAGGMLDLMCQSQNRGLIDNNMEGIINLLQGAVYSIGLFYVISMGMELFNSNILFFSVGVMRGAVTIMDLFISWFISFWVNLASTIFVVYLFCHVSGVTSTGNYVNGSREIAETKESFTFMQTFLKGVAGNFFVCLAVYLQIMVKPLHVKVCMIFLPIFTFVAMGFTHVVADMFLIPAGLFNNCNFGWGRYFWKLLIPAALGNIVGGSFFGIAIPWYLHLYVIEQDMKELQLPSYDEKDEQPLLNMDSRVIRTPTINTMANYNNVSDSETSSTINKPVRSPKGVFPVYDMGPALKKERTIASSYTQMNNASDIESVMSNAERNKTTTQNSDIPLPSEMMTGNGSLSKKVFRHFSFGGGGSNTDEINRRMNAAKITPKAAGMANDIAGIHTDSIDYNFHDRQSVKRKSISSVNSNISQPALNPKQSPSSMGAGYGSGTKSNGERTRLQNEVIVSGDSSSVSIDSYTEQDGDK